MLLIWRWITPAITLALLSLTAHAQSITGTPASDLPQGSPFDYQVQRSRDTGWWESDKPNCWGWYRHNLLIGRWWQDIDTWQAWDGRRWGPEIVPPWQRADRLPGAKPAPGGGLNFGLDQDRLRGQGERYLIGDMQLAASELPIGYYGAFKDDSQTKHVTVFDANPARRQQTVLALKGQLGDKVRLNDYSPTDPNQKTITLDGWKLGENQRFQQTGQMVAMQAPADKDQKGNPTGYGQVIGTHYGPLTAEAMASIARAADPNYDPNKNGAGGSLSLAWIWSNVIWPFILMMLGGAGGAGAVMAMRGKPQAPDEIESKPSRGSIIAQQLLAWKEEMKAARARADDDAKEFRDLLMALGNDK